MTISHRVRAITSAVAICAVYARTGVAVGQESDLDVLVEYRSGDADAAIARFVALPRQDAEKEVQQLAESEVPGMLQAAAAIHTEIALRRLASSTADTDDHLGRARLLVHLGEPGQDPGTVDQSPVSAEFRRLWYLAVGVYAEYSGRLDRFGWDVARGCELFPNDAEMQLVCGAADELLASPRVLASPEDLKRKHLAQAERELRRAVDLDPASVEARLRLGRVIMLRGERATARELLTSVIEAAAPRLTQRYLAALFLARLEDESGDLTAAETWYSRALEIVPAAQSARLGLSELRHRANDRAAAAQMLAPPFGEPAVWDPWFGYLFGEQGRLPELLAALRREARQ
jgi:tetratricopeptide (TPR) repeat protein